MRFLLMVLLTHDLSGAGKGIRLQLAMAGASICLLSAALYLLRNRVAVFKTLGAKRFWLDAHIVLGTLGPLVIAFHASHVGARLAGAANLAMWCTVISGVLARYLFPRVPLARMKREWLLQTMEEFTREAILHLSERLKPSDASRVQAAFTTAIECESQPRLPDLFRQFFADIGTILVILSPRIRRVASGNARGKPGVLLTRQLMLMRNVLFLKVVENSAELWRQIHIYLSILFGTLVGLHVLIVLLFKPQFIFH